MEYEKLGFKCGIEIHQQLDTRKLFCNCPSIVHDSHKADIKIERRLRAVVGETGEVDKAASYEQSKEKKMIYEACSTSSCLVELDEEPPQPINPESVEIGIQIALMLNAKIVDEIQVMRKTVVDGSNVSGFQRTALIAMDGYIETSLGKVRIPSICLEEEAAKKIHTGKDSITYRLDRLGVALVEIATEPDITNAEHAKETAEKIGMILRSTGKVKRGIGTIRQDVNVSIKGHPRVEIKGFQDLRSIPKTVEKEVKRQLKEIKNNTKNESHVRKAESDFSSVFLRPMPGAARMYPETDVTPLKISKEYLKSIEIPELIEDKVKNVAKKHDIEESLALKLLKSNNIELFENISKKAKNLKKAYIADTLLSYCSDVKKKDENLDTDKITDEDLKTILLEVDQENISKNSVCDILVDIAKGKKLDISKYKLADDKELESDIKKMMKEKPNLNPGAYMGMIMAKYKGKIDGKKAMEVVNRLLR